MLGNTITNGEVLINLGKILSGLVGKWHRPLNEAFI